MTSIALVLSGAIIVIAVVCIAIEEGRRRGKAESESDHATKAFRARDKLDEILANPVGRRWKLVEFLKDRIAGKEGKK